MEIAATIEAPALRILHREKRSGENGTSPGKMGKNLGRMSGPQIAQILAWRPQDVPFRSGDVHSVTHPARKVLIRQTPVAEVGQGAESLNSGASAP